MARCQPCELSATLSFLVNTSREAGRANQDQHECRACHEADERSAFRNPAAAHGRGHRNPGRPCERGAGQGGPRRTRAGRDLKVTSWIDTDADGRPREIAEIIIALGSAGVFTAIVSAIRVWLERNKIKDAVLEAPNGT